VVLSFKTYLEAFHHTPGAFGREQSAWDFSKDRGRFSMKHQTQGIETKHQDRKDRIEFGKKKEGVIIEAMKGLGWIVRGATAQEDMFRHIDAWIKRTPASPEVPVQIKYRDSGDDILVEVIKYWTPDMFHRRLQESDFNGRDMSGNAAFYVGLNQARDTLRIRPISEAHSLAKSMTEVLAADFSNLGKRTAFSRAGIIRLVPDPANGREKVMAYIRPDAFNMKEDVKLKSALW
jgi:hypothetical protein